MTENAVRTIRCDEGADPKAAALRRRATLLAVAVAAVLVVAKLIAWRASGSIAILGSLIDSVLDLLASGVNLIAVRHALEPPDHEHRFGHGKAEALAGLGRGVLVFVSAGFLASEAVLRLIEPMAVRNGELAMGVLAFSALASLGLALYQLAVYRRTRSVAIGADAANYGADVAVSLGALGAVWISMEWGFAMADPLFGFAIAAMIAFATWSVIAQSYDQLMDREMSDLEREEIKRIVLAHPEALGIHDLRTRRSGVHLFIQFHLELDPELSLREAHRVADEVERAVAAAFPEAEVIAHQEPVGEFIENDLVKT